jgi:hypothetical protein
MKTHRLARFLEERQGAAGIMTALLIIVFVAILAIVIDLGHLHGVRNELQNAADASALAGARALFQMENYPVVVAPDPPLCSVGITKAQEALQANVSDMANLTLSNMEVTLGWWDWANNGPFTPMTTCKLDEVNAVRVQAKRTDGGGVGPVAMTLAVVFGWDTAAVGATSVAAVGYMIKNCTVAPIALCANYYDMLTNNSGEYFAATFRSGTNKPDMLDEAYWDNPCDLGNPPAKWLRDWIDGKIEPPCYEYDCVYCNTGEKSSVVRGSLKPKLAEMQSNSSGTCSETDTWKHLCSKTGTCHEGWLITVPVLPVNPASGDCDCDKAVTGVVWKPVVVRAVYTPNEVNNPNTPIDPKIREQCAKSQAECMEIAAFPCDVVIQGEGGGTEPTVYATRPKLVWFDTHAPN